MSEIHFREFVFPRKDREKDKEFVNFFVKHLDMEKKLAELYGVILYIYPFTQGAFLPRVLCHTMNMEESEVEEGLDSLLNEYRLLEIEDGFIKEPVRYFRRDETGKDLLDLIEKTISERIKNDALKDQKSEEIISLFRETLWPDVHLNINERMENRPNEYCQVISCATNREGIDTFFEDLTIKEEDLITELIIPSFSLKTHNWEDEKKKYIDLLEAGVDIKLLLYSEKIGWKKEPCKQTKPDIQEGIEKAKEIVHSNFKVRKINNWEHSNFRGLIRKSSLSNNWLYRFFVQTDKERGVNAVVLRGKHKDNTLLKVLDSYFKMVWEEAEDINANWWDKWGKGLAIYVCLPALPLITVIMLIGFGIVDWNILDVYLTVSTSVVTLIISTLNYIFRKQLRQYLGN